eukprot:GHVU01081864.1.p1 GENE.GHVU01081864.1~~GHVU01081864.1.p1  ORF type:complete len:388 (-),score=43.75 GHVU01081864.1:610-1773(-)
MSWFPAADEQFAKVGEAHAVPGGFIRQEYRLPGAPPASTPFAAAAASAPAQPGRAAGTLVDAAVQTGHAGAGGEVGDATHRSAITSGAVDGGICTPVRRNRACDSDVGSPEKSWEELMSVDRLATLHVVRRKAPRGATHFTDSPLVIRRRQTADAAAAAAVEKAKLAAQRKEKRAATAAAKAAAKAAGLPWKRGAVVRVQRADARESEGAPVEADAIQTAKPATRKRKQLVVATSLRVCVACASSSSGSKDKWVQCLTCARWAHDTCVDVVDGVVLCGRCPAAAPTADVSAALVSEVAAGAAAPAAKRHRATVSVVQDTGKGRGARRCAVCISRSGDRGGSGWVQCAGCEEPLHGSCGEKVGGAVICIICMQQQQLPAGGRRGRGGD